MVDVRLIGLIPPAPAVTQVSSSPTVTTQGAAIVPQLPTGSVLAGFIINRDPAGNPILRTEQGDFVFSSNLFLKIGSEVVIRIQQTSGHPSAHIITVNGQPPEAAIAQSAFIDEPEVIVSKQSPPAPQQTPQQQAQTATVPAAPATSLPKIGQTISAIVITPNFTPPTATSTSAPALAAPTIAPGTSFLLSVLGVGERQPQVQPVANSPLSQLTSQQQPTTAPSALSSLLPASPLPATPTAATPAPITTTVIQTPTAAPEATAQPPLQAAPIPVPVLPANPSGQALPFSTSNQQAAASQLSGPLGHTINAVVIAHEPDGSATLVTPLGVLRAPEASSVPIGQQLTLRVASVVNPNNATIAIANAAAPIPTAPLTELSRTWTSLQHIVQVLGKEEAQLIIPTFPTGPNITPDIPGKITQSASQILFFIAALKGGNFRDWLGAPNIKALEDKGYGALVKKAEGEFVQMARQFAESQPNNWQSTFFPVMAGGVLEQVRAFIKREKKKNEEGKPTGDEDTRFVVEMELSQLGEMQMDGLVKRRDSKLQFDLIIRSHYPLPKAFEQDINAIFTGTAEITGYRGQLSFQSMQHFPLNPLEDTTPHVFDDVVV